MNDDVVLVAPPDIARTALAPRAALVLLRLIVDAGPARRWPEVSRVFRRADRQPADARGVRAGRGAVPGRGARRGAWRSRRSRRCTWRPTSGPTPGRRPPSS